MLNISKLEYCELEYQDNWLTLLINNKNKKNALSKKLINEIITILDSLKNDDSIRGVILRGKNNIFCSGADLEELHQIAYNKKNKKELTIEMSKNIGKLLKSIRDTPQITISVIEGPCIAGGFGIACATDIIITIKDSIFRLSETRLGLTPIQIAPYIFNRLNYSKARLMMLMGDTIDGEKAYDLGIADYLVKSKDNIENIINKLKIQVNQCSPNAISITKREFSTNFSIDIEKAAEIFFECIEHSEGKEGLQSFFEKNKPSWTI